MHLDSLLIYHFFMKEDSPGQHVATQAYDLASRTKFILREGQILVETEGNPEQTWNIPPPHNISGHRNYLHFATPNSSHLQINPWGNLLVCHSQRVQEADLSQTYSSGQIWWELFIPHTVLSLTVGVKEKTKNRYINFDLSFKSSTRLTFKLNFTTKTFKVWINGVQSETKQPLSILQEGYWTPFVRIRESGATISINPFVDDPENRRTQTNFFIGAQIDKQGLKGEVSISQQNFQFKKNESFSEIRLQGQKLFLIGTNQVSWINRNSANGLFQLHRTVQVQQKEGQQNYLVKLQQGQFNILQQACKAWNVNLLFGAVLLKGSIWLKGNKQQWLSLFKKVFNFLDDQLISSKNQLTKQTYFIYLSLNQRLTDALELPQRASRWSIKDNNIVGQIDRLSLYEAKPFLESQQNPTQVVHSLVFTNKISGVYISNGYLSVVLESSKLSIYSIKNLPFKLGDYIISKSIKKHNEIAQCAKEADQIKGSLGQPTIYKILKNCLKYADKVKPPQNLVKELETKRQKMKEKEKKPQVKTETNKTVPDKNLEGTLVTMGFGLKLVQKALMLCKNASLEAAMDLILGGTIVVQQQKPPAPSKDWTCQTCTLVNSRTNTVCAACDSPFPKQAQQIEKVEEVKQEIKVQQTQQEIASQKIEEALTNVYVFPTGLAIAPIIVAGVFSSKVRFRLFALNPKFFSSCYEAGDLFADLISHNYYQNVGSFPSNHIQRILSYLSPQQCKQRCLSWIPVEDYEYNAKKVQNVRFDNLGFDEHSLRVKVQVLKDNISQYLYFTLDTNKVYVEKQRSLTHSPSSSEAFSKLLLKPQQKQKEIQKEAKFSYNNSAVNPTSFEIFLLNNNLKRYETIEQNAKPVEKNLTNTLVNLYVEHSPQHSVYPQVNFYSPWKQAFKNCELWRNALILKSTASKLVQFQSLTFEIANPQQRVQGFYYFTNDYMLQPARIYKFAFEANTKKVYFDVPKTKALYLVVGLFPHQDKLIQLTNVLVYGQTLEDQQIPNLRELKIDFQGDLNIKLEALSNENRTTISPTLVQVFSVNLSHDLSTQSQNLKQTIMNFADLKILVHLQNSASKIHLQDISTKDFTMLKINTIKNSVSYIKSSKQIDVQFTQLFNHYLLTKEQVSLQKLINAEFSSKKSQANLENFQSYFNTYLVYLSNNTSQLNHVQAFLGFYLPSIISQRQKINLSKLIEQGLRSQRLTANGLQVLLWLNRQTSALSIEELTNLNSEVITKIKNRLSSQTKLKQYNMFEESSIFSPYLHLKGYRDQSDKFDRITSRILLQKLRYSKLFTLDLFSCYSLRNLQLNFERSQVKSKLMIHLKWFNENNQTQGMKSFVYNYSAWSSFTTDRKVLNKSLSINLLPYNIRTRYLEVECSYTLQPFTATKGEVANLPENEILPIVYGTFVGQAELNPKFLFDFQKKNMQFVKKIGKYSKFIVTSPKKDLCVFEEQDHLSQVFDVQLLNNKLDIHGNKQKWIYAMMSKASHDNLNYHYTLFACLSIEILKLRDMTRVSTEAIEGLVQILNKQVGFLYEITLKILILLLEKHSTLALQLLSQQFVQGSIEMIFKKYSAQFKKQNLFSNPEVLQYVVKECKNQNKIVAKNCLALVSTITINNQNKKVVIELLSLFVRCKLLEQGVKLVQAVGWIEGVNLLIDQVLEADQSASLFLRILKSVKQQAQILNYLQDYLANRPPNTYTLAILDEFTSRLQNRKINGNNLYQNLYKWINNEQNTHTSQPDLIAKLLKNIKYFDLDQKNIKNLLQVYFDLYERNIIWTEIKHQPFIKQQSIIRILLELSLNEINKYVEIPKRKRKGKNYQLAFIQNILQVILDEHQIQKHKSEKIGHSSHTTLAKMLASQLNWNGRESRKYLNEVCKCNQSIAYYLAKIASPTASNTLEIFAKWYIHNLNKEEELSSTLLSGQYNFILSKVWSIIINILQTQSKQVSILQKVIKESLKQSYAVNKSNRFYAVLLREKIFQFLANLLQQLKKRPSISSQMSELLGKGGILNTLLSTIEGLKDLANEQNQVIVQHQLANQLRLLQVQKPQDWLLYRNGVKNHVFQIGYEGKNSHSLFFQKQFAFWPSVIAVGFQTNSGNNTVYAPKDVLVQVGQTKNKLEIVGSLQLIPFQSFGGYSIKVYAINLFRTNLSQPDRVNFNNCKVLKLTFVSPYQHSTEDAAEQNNSFTITKSVSYINFLSIVGYAQNWYNKIPENLTSLVKILDLLCDQTHLKNLKSLLQDNTTFDLVSKSLKGISYLLSTESFGSVAHKFLLRICETNSELGEKMLSSYLEMNNPILSAKMAEQITLSSQEHSVTRAKRFFSNIVQRFSNGLADNQLLPFIERFTSTISTLIRNYQLQPEVFQTLECEVSQVFINKSLKNSLNTLVFRKFTQILLSSSLPIKFKIENKEQIWTQLYKSDQSAYSQLLAILINSDLNCKEWFASKNFLGETFKQIVDNLKEKDGSIPLLISKLKFITLLCRNRSIKEEVTKAQMDLQIFELLVNGNSQGLLARPDSKELRQGLVNFIATASLDSPNQRIIGALLKDSLNAAVLESSSQFVGEVFLPLLNSFSKIAVCLIPYSLKENRVMPDLSCLQQFKTQTKQQIRPSQKFKLNTLILNEDQKNSLYSVLRQTNGIKWGNFKLLTNHGQLSASKHLLSMRDQFNKEKNMLILLQANKNILGIFYNPPKQSASKNVLHLTKGSFIFKCNEKQITQLTQTSNRQVFATIQKSESSFDQLNICLKGKVVAEIKYDGNGGSILRTSLFKDAHQSAPAELFKDKAVQKQQAITSVQYWYLDNDSVESYQSVWANQKMFAKRLLSQLTECNFFRPQFKTTNSVQLLRQQPLFQFPSSLTLKELLSAIQILGKTCKVGSNFQVRLANGTHPNHLFTLQQLAKGQNGQLILELLIDLQGVVQNLQLNSTQKKAEFLPTRGILKYFQENEGVKSMIKAIKKSICDWKNVTRKQKWLQYINQLQKFSGFPHFFGVYLRQKQTFNLLLELLSGLPDRETDTKWDQKQAKSSQRLLKIVSDILNMENSQQFRSHALKHDFLITILQRLKILTGTFVRHYEAVVEEEEVKNSSPSKGETEDDGTKKVKKKKGVGYSQDTNSNTKWMKGQNLITIKKEFESIQPILMLIQGFLGGRSWKAPHQLLKQLLNSCLLPYLEQCLRAGTLLEMSKHPEKYRAVLKLVRSLAHQQNLVSCLIPIPTNYQPAQNQSIQSLLKSLFNTSKIFLSCLGPNLSKQDKISQQLANDIIDTYNLVEDAVAELAAQGEEGVELEHALTTLPLDKKYRILMRELRFDYMDMKDSPTKIKHHYSSNFQANYQPNQTKMIRLAQELADISTALPHQHTNAIYVRCDKDRVDFMQALIMGSNGTPYGHGAFLFDIYFDDNYPNGPPKVNLTTTGHGKIRFNPNLYACGKVCLSLLGTWRGSASQNWDPKVSTLLQVLLSIQAIIMSEQVYFNEPGFENQQGTEEGEKKNEAYSNIVRYGNVKFAMLQNIKNPPKGFESVIRRHFYLKKDQILDECRKWLKYAEKRPANYIGLVNDHNSSWSTQFKKNKTQYKDMLQKAIKQLQQQIAKLPAPSIGDLASKQTAKKTKKKKQVKDLKSLQMAQHQEIDVSYDNKMQQDRELDINDQKVKDRWSRYIGAMGIDAVSRQAKADILVFGLGPFALEIIKNLVLSGCRKLTIVDDSLTKIQDISGGFFYQLEDVGKKRVDAILYKIRELNCYVKVDTLSKEACTAEIIQKYALVLATELLHQQQIKISKICREKGIKFVSADCFGATCRITNDFGKFQVLDRNGEEPVQVMIKEIEISEKGLVTLLDGSKHSYEDGEGVVINNIEGMKLIEDKGKSINSSIRKIKVVNFKSFQIGDTRMFQPYIRNGTIKNIKTPVNLQFPSVQKAFDANSPLDIDAQLVFYDFAKQSRSALLRLCFIALDKFRQSEKRIVQSWNKKDAELFITYLQKLTKTELTKEQLQFAHYFAFSCKGNLPPLCAFFGGFVAQEIIKGITQKYKPVIPSFYLNFLQLLPKKEQGKEWTNEDLSEIYTKGNSREEGFASVVGRSLVSLAAQSRVFMIGAGAIGCQLLKNFAMVGLGTGQNGKIILTDPDHIQNSNLNRQFLFRQKHISKPKSLTAAASVSLMNPKLKTHITPLLERVSETTREIFSNRFFSGLTAVANALDNVAARRYVDQRCVQNQVALFDSGTLGPKGHVQVVIPFKTESYGSQNDPVQQGQIPHCTLKLFPEETLHCIEWARDIFGRKFTLQPKALTKFLQKGYTPQSGDIKALTQSLKMATKGPRVFDDCLQYAINKFYKYYRDDIMQLLYTYPLDAKTKNGEPFWRLPKRPPTPIMEFNPEDPLHSTFVMSLAVLTAKIYQIPFPPNFRTQKERLLASKQASKIKIKQFVPSDQLAKAILKQTAIEQKKKQDQGNEQNEQIAQEKGQVQNSKNQVDLHKELIKNAGSQFLVKNQEFQKDDDANGHIDFIYAAANLRALNYKLQLMDWITTKLKAGRIVPALATTTSCVAGLQTLQLLKYLKKISVQSMKNSYLNLAVPNIQMSEPGQAKKKKLKEGLSVTLWDKWEVKCTQDITFGEVYEKLKKQYGLCPIGVLQGMSRIDFGKGEAEKKKFLSSKVLDKLEREGQQQYLDIVVLFTESEEDEKILEGIPPVRLCFSKK